MLAVTADSAERIAVVVAIALVLLAALLAKVLIGNLAKTVAAVLLVAAAVFVWTQRSSLQDCIQRVERQAQDAPGEGAECTVSGLTFTVDLGR